MESPSCLGSVAKEFPQNCQKLLDGRVTLDFDGTWRNHGATYYASQRKVLFQPGHCGEELTLHELGHALDDLNLPDEPGVWLRSQRDPEVQQNYQNYMTYRTPEWSEYARTNPQEFVADGIRWYHQDEHSRAQLRGCDPLHFRYIEAMLRQELPPLSTPG